MLKLVTTIVAALCAAALVPSSASAISMQYANGQIGVAAQPGEHNDLRIHTTKAADGRRWLYIREFMNKGQDLMDAGKLVVDFDTRYCRVAYADGKKVGIMCHSAAVSRVKVVVGDMNDRVITRVPAITFQIAGGPGDDWLYGGHADDKLLGGPGNDRIYGDSDVCCGTDDTPRGRGDDQIDGGPGVDFLFGRDGNDNINPVDSSSSIAPNQDFLHGGRGFDVLDYTTSPQPVTVSLNAVSGNGMSGEYDLITDRDFEGVTGSAWGDKLYGGPFPDFLSGRGGNDRIEGGSGSDGIAGGDGNDTLLPGLGADLVHGERGNDRIEAVDDETDTVHCGDGYDIGLVDEDLDKWTSCEQRWESWPGS